MFKGVHSHGGGEPSNGTGSDTAGRDDHSPDSAAKALSLGDLRHPDLQAMRDLVEKAQTERRALTPEEVARINRILANVDTATKTLGDAARGALGKPAVDH